ncbi:HAD family hydrolase [Streptomyces clavuligerus]|nr:HAD family hydrolase [Streptomyces clavuligerus]MBY6301459.1 HAD family hydrolase [Streptomyces clavuligerus]QPL66383.1 HAD family hydrolase [Streptomyces clavuligerus]QPL72415.1 HAD family hydrolase [Streptomyces clavuligerus]QPL78489.1 HAD family hydrolase [Streptomyces clavuligerus]
MVPPLPPTHASVFHRLGLGRYAERWGDQWSTGPGDGEEHGAHSVSGTAYRAWEVDRLRRRALDRGVPAERAADLARELDRATKSLRLDRFADVPQALARLRERGLTVALCSNWFWDLDRAVAETGLAHLVDTAVTSARAGARKPHPRIYRAALDACGTAPGEALFVGDMWEADVLGPLAQGIRAAHLHRPDRAVDGPAPPLPGGAHRISSLAELPELLDRLDGAGPHDRPGPISPSGPAGPPGPP